VGERVTGSGNVHKLGLELESPKAQPFHMSESCPRGYWLRQQ